MNDRCTLVRGGIQLDDEVVPLYAGSVHYWQLDPADWRACLLAVRDLGLRLVDTYLPWGVHETGPGKLELGERDPQRDVVRFLKIAQELGLWAIVRPGPHINAELTYFGIPERIVWDPACQARTPGGNPVMLPMVPKMFPVPSYASEAYLDEVTRYFHVLGAALSPLRYPDGPIVMLQIDNEGALYFRDGAYDQDYHPDAIAQYRGFLRRKYKTLTELRLAYGSEGDDLKFSSIEPPTSFEASRAEELCWYLDWAEFQEHLLANALGRFKTALDTAGLGGLPTSHNFPLAQETTPLNAARVLEVVDLVGLDYYNRASTEARAGVAARTSELGVRCDACDVPAFGCEMGAGFPPFFPPLSERDSAFTVLCALAYGLRGFNVYMAVGRDRWIGAPIDAHGRPRPFADMWRKLCTALEQTDFANLHRRVPVRLLVPRVERRLARVMHAFGPATGALLHIMGFGPREGGAEDDLGLGYPLAVEADTFIRSFAQALDARGVPFAVVGGEDRQRALSSAQWIVCATSGGFSRELASVLAAQTQARISIGPHRPTRDGAMKPADLGLGDVEIIERNDPTAADASVARAIDALGLANYACDPDDIHATVHEDSDGIIRVVFVINPTERDVVARIALGCDAAWEDALGGATASRSTNGVLEIRMHPKTVRMLRRAGGSNLVTS